MACLGMRVGRVMASGKGDERASRLEERINAGEFGRADTQQSLRDRLTKPLRRKAAEMGGPGRALAMAMAQQAVQWRTNAKGRMPTASGDIREIVGQPVFVPLYKLYRVYGGVFRLSFGPKQFVVLSDPKAAKQVLMENAGAYSKGILSEILDFVMGQGLIPAGEEVWKVRRRAIQPALHRKYIEAMVDMFGDCTMHGCEVLEDKAKRGESVEMENYFSRYALDVIGKAVFNYDFDSLTKDDPVIQAVYTTLREAEYRSIAFLPYWKIKALCYVVPRQRKCLEALEIINETLDTLISRTKRLVEEEDEDFVEDYLNRADPSILHFLIASGDEVTSKQLRDDLMTLLIAGHETTAAVLTWTMYCLVQNQEVVSRLREEVDRVLGDRKPAMEDLKELKFTTRCINEAMRLYPQPPVLIRRALEDDVINGFDVKEGSDIFISVWNLHHAPELWEDSETFNPDRFPLDEPMPNEKNQDFKYLPFGGGRRKCIGEQFALFESITALAMIVRRFNFEMDPEAPEVTMTTGATIHVGEGFYLKMKKRGMPQSGTPGSGNNGGTGMGMGEQGHRAEDNANDATTATTTVL